MIPSTDAHRPAGAGTEAGMVTALILALAAAAATGLYQPPADKPPAWGPGWLTTTAQARVDATRTAVAIRATEAAVRAATATAAARPTATLTPTRTAPLAGGAYSEGQAIDPPAPFFTFGRPFDSTHEVRASRFYPYGTTADGAYLLHHGVDIGNGFGTPVLAVGAGEVVFAGEDVGQDLWGPMPDFYGRVVAVRHPQSLESRPLHSIYGHLSEITAQVGQSVAAGDTVGLVGSAGIALGPHLHLEFRVGDRPSDYGSTRNPELLLAPLPGHGTIVGRVVDMLNRPIQDVTLGLYAVEAGGREQWIAQTTTYPARHVNSSADIGENFVFADTLAGRYVVSAIVAGGVVTMTLRAAR